MNNVKQRTWTAIILIAMTMLIITGCYSSVAGPNQAYRTQSTYQMEHLNADQRYIVDEPLRPQPTRTAVAKFNAQMIFMADQIERNADRKSLANTFIVTSFSNLNKLSETTPFGRLVAENLIHEIQVRKWKVFEVRLTRDVIINETGEFSLSRDIRKLKEMYKVGGIVTGTYSVVNDHVILNVRVVNINTGLVESSAQAHMPVNWFTDALLINEDSFKPMKIVGDTPFQPVRTEAPYR